MGQNVTSICSTSAAQDRECGEWRLCGDTQPLPGVSYGEADAGVTFKENGTAGYLSVEENLGVPNFSTAACAAPSTGPKRHLVLNMDINKTIIMTDKVSSKTTEMVANEVVANCAWGHQVGDKWFLKYDEPAVLRPEPVNGSTEEVISFAEYLDVQMHGPDFKKTRTKLNGCFTHDDQPGKELNGHVRRMCAVLKRPDGKDVKIIPSFFELLLSLKRAKRSFSLCFRTFGADLEDVAEELNSFCEGRHPYYPGVRMDGSDGDPDYRFRFHSKDGIGTFHREAGVCSIVMGTQEQAGEGTYRDCKDKTLAFYDQFQNLEIISGFDAVMKHVKDVGSRCGTVGFRDYFGYWKQKKMTSEGGKMFFFDPRSSTNRHEIFFDDNITFRDGYIVQPVNMSCCEKKPWLNALLDTHLCRAEPLMSIVNNDYFVEELARLEAGYERKLLAQNRLLQALKKIVKMKAVCKNFLTELRQEKEEQKMKDYDAWGRVRKSNKRLSLVEPNDMSEAQAF